MDAKKEEAGAKKEEAKKSVELGMFAAAIDCCLRSSCLWGAYRACGELIVLVGSTVVMCSHKKRRIRVRRGMGK